MTDGNNSLHAMLKALVVIDAWLSKIMRWFSIGCLTVLAVVLTCVVFVRFVPIASLSWSDEIVEWAFAWMVFIGAAALWRRDEHFCVDALSCKLIEKRSGHYHRLFIELLSASFLVVFVYYGYQLTIQANDRSPMLEWPRPLWYACMPLSGAIMLGYSLRSIVRLLLVLSGSSITRSSGPDDDKVVVG